MIKNDEEFSSALIKRNTGKVTFGIELKSNTEKKDLLEVFLKKMGHNPEKIRGNWRQVDKTYAKNILKYVLSMNMTHDIDLETKPLADQLSNYFLDKFEREATFYTNGEFDSNSGFFKLYSWITINNSRWNTFDTGIVAVDNMQIGILWATDSL